MNKPLIAVSLALAAALATALRPAAAAAAVDITIKDDKGRPAGDAVAYLIPSNGKAPELTGEPVAIMDQKGMQYVPRVLPIQTGTRVRFPNSDNILHHVYSFSAAKTFELPLYKGKTQPPVLFDKPGAVVLGCNIHDWMIGYILVLDTPFFAKTGPGGKAELRDVPPGEYKVFIWHPDMKDEKKTEAGTLKLGDSGNKALEFGISLNLKKKTRRMPVNGRGMGY